jgi:hypothetical protein
VIATEELVAVPVDLGDEGPLTLSTIWEVASWDLPEGEEASS